VPTDEDWTVLTDYLAADGQSGVEGTALKSTSGWDDSWDGTNGNGKDDYGWLGLPGGLRSSYGYFSYLGSNGHWWSSSEGMVDLALPRYLGSNYDYVSSYSEVKRVGYSVRCLNDDASSAIPGEDSLYLVKGDSVLSVYATTDIDSITFYRPNSTLTSTTSQVRLENGETPLDIYQSGVPIDSIVGKTYQGGVIAYLDTLDGTGLIAAPTDQSDGVAWGCYGTLISGADGTEIGTGNQNTADILAGCSETNSASYFCDTLTLGGYNDWFLPSKDELNKLYENIGQGNALGLGNVGGFANDDYWSSTEYGHGSAWKQGFDYGTQYYGIKSSYGSVRAVRAFSNDSIITDADGNVYSSVTIGTQEWMSENLRTTKYSDGTAIPNVTSNSDWRSLSTGAWCHADNDSSQYEAMYGKLYNWYAVNTNKLCPTGWHVPTEAEWDVLTDYLTANGHSGSEGTALKATSGWNDYNGQSGNGTDDYGWLGLPGGNRASSGDFGNIGNSGRWWSSSQSITHDAWIRYLSGSNDAVDAGYVDLRSGFSVRCLRD
jgi:uncharacterized protein (TIGR02145 family)